MDLCDLNGDRDYNPGEVNLDPQGPDFVAVSAGVQPRRQPGRAASRKPTGPRSRSSARLRRAGPPGRRRSTHATSDNQRLLDPWPAPTRATTSRITRPGSWHTTACSARRRSGQPTITFYDVPCRAAGTRRSRRSMLINDPGRRSRPTRPSRSPPPGGTPMAGSSTRPTRPPRRTSRSGPGRRAYNPNAEIFIADNTWEWSAKAVGRLHLPARHCRVGELRASKRRRRPARQVLFTAPGSTIPSDRAERRADRVDPHAARQYARRPLHQADRPAAPSADKRSTSVWTCST